MFKKISLSAMIFTYLFAGLAHFAKRDYFLGIAPRFLSPSIALASVGITGLLEVLFSFFLIFPKTRRGACYGIILFWSMSLPINIFVAGKPALYQQLPQWELAGMVPFHILLIVWAWWYIRTQKTTMSSQSSGVS